MGLIDLNHFAVRVPPGRLRQTADFYVQVLGLADGARPPFAFPGHWLYCGETAVVHLIGRDDEPGGGAAKDTGRLDHIAFRADDLAGMRARLDGRGIAYSERTVPGAGLRQIFVHDPNGIRIELNFAAPEVG